MLLGSIVLLMAPASIPITVSAGYILIAAGAVTLIATLCAHPYPGFGPSLLAALIGLATAMGLLQNLSDGSIAPRLLFTAYFAFSGAVTILIAVAHRRGGSSQWEWLVISGVTNLILALLVASGLPGPFTWMLGVLLGVALIFNGSARLAVALASNAITHRQVSASPGDADLWPAPPRGAVL